MVKCLIEGKEVEALWDTGSQVCVLSRKWQQTHLPLEVLRNVEELLGAGEKLNLEAMNGTNIPFDGWIEVRFKLARDDTTADELTVPVLVRQKERRVPDHWHLSCQSREKRCYAAKRGGNENKESSSLRTCSRGKADDI